MTGRVLLILLLSVSVFIEVPSVDAITVDDYQPGISAKGIASSRHNLGGFGRVVRTGSTTEICIFCHTPHHKNASATPLWNRSVPSPASFTAYGPTASGSSITSVSGPSLACLSCHDGVTTFDNLVNTPGKGGVVPGGADRVWGFNMPVGSSGMAQNNDIRLDGFHTGRSQICSMCHNAMTAISLEYIASMNIGTNLSNDHPVSVSYNDTLAGAGLRLKSTIISTIDLVSELSPSADPALLHNLSQNRWAVNGFISDTATVNDLLRGGNVECTSCHDPHFSNKSWDEADPTYVTPTGSMSGMTYSPGWCINWEDCSDGLFLRRVGGNSGSGVCRTCHDK